MLLPRLNSCCGCWSLREGVLVLAIVFTVTSSTVIFVGFYVIYLTDPYCTIKRFENSSDRRTEKLRAYVCATMFSAVLMLLVSLALLAGAVRRDAQLLLPWLFTISIIASCIFLYGFHMAMVKMPIHFGEACVSMFLLIAGEALPCFMFLLVYSFYHELRLERKSPALQSNLYAALHT